VPAGLVAAVASSVLGTAWPDFMALSTASAGQAYRLTFAGCDRNALKYHTAM
jgi:hypothetical protein